MVIAALALNIKSWFATGMHIKQDRQRYITMEFRRFLHSIILIACRIVRRACSIVIRLIGYQPTHDHCSVRGEQSGVSVSYRLGGRRASRANDESGEHPTARTHAVEVCPYSYSETRNSTTNREQFPGQHTHPTLSPEPPRDLRRLF